MYLLDLYWTTLLFILTKMKFLSWNVKGRGEKDSYLNLRN